MAEIPVTGNKIIGAGNNGTGKELGIFLITREINSKIGRPIDRKTIQH